MNYINEIEEKDVAETDIVEEEKEENTQVKEEEYKSPTRLDVTKLNKEEKEYSEVVEEERTLLLAANKRARTRSNICSFIIIGLLIFSVFFITNKEGLQFLSFVGLGAAVITIIVFMIINKRTDRPDVQTYIKKASLAINRYVFNNADFKDVTYDPLEKLELGDVNDDNVYLGATKIASRNITRGFYKSRSFVACELALFLTIDRRQQTCFVGKYLSIPNDLTIEGQYLLTLSGEKAIDISNATGTMSLLSEVNNLKIYGPENGNFKDLGNHFVEMIKKIKLNEHLLNVHVSLRKGKTVIYASYDDDTITLPFKDPYKKETAEQYRQDLISFLEAAHSIIKE